MCKVDQNECKYIGFTCLGIQFPIIWALLSIFLLVACGPSKPRPIPPGDPSLPEIDVLQLKENSEEALKLSQENRLEMQALKAHVMELEGRISGLSEAVANFPLSEFDTLHARIDSLRGAILIVNDRVTRIPQAPPPRALATFSPSPSGVNQGKLIGNLNASASMRVIGDSPGSDSFVPGPSKGKGKSGQGSALSGKASVAEAGAYRQAFDTYYSGNYQKARKQFQEISEKWPGGSYAANSLYWISECDFGLGKYPLAIEGFKKVVVLPESEKADDAQLKIGYAHLKLENKKAAAEAFRKLVSLFPDSEYLERAKEELDKLD